MSVTPGNNPEAVSPELGDGSETEHVENTKGSLERNLVYEEDEEPEFHARTFFALAAMFLLNLVQIFCLMGPPAGVGKSTL